MENTAVPISKSFVEVCKTGETEEVTKVRGKIKGVCSLSGGAGFIGSEFVRQLVAREYRPIVIDKLTYAGNLARLKEVYGRYKFYKVDIWNKRKVEE